MLVLSSGPLEADLNVFLFLFVYSFLGFIFYRQLCAALGVV